MARSRGSSKKSRKSVGAKQIKQFYKKAGAKGAKKGASRSRSKGRSKYTGLRNDTGEPSLHVDGVAARNCAGTMGLIATRQPPAATLKRAEFLGIFKKAPGRSAIVMKVDAKGRQRFVRSTRSQSAKLRGAGLRSMLAFKGAGRDPAYKALLKSVAGAAAKAGKAANKAVGKLKKATQKKAVARGDGAKIASAKKSAVASKELSAKAVKGAKGVKVPVRQSPRRRSIMGL